MRESAGEVAFFVGVHHHEIIAFRVILMVLQINVVELRDVVLELFLLHHLFDKVLPLIPPPGFIQLTEVFHYK